MQEKKTKSQPALEDTVNSQIRDSVAQVNTIAVKSSASHSAAMIDVVMAGSIGLAMFNAVNTQQNAKMIASAAVVEACAKMLKIRCAAPLAAHDSSVVNGENR